MAVFIARMLFKTFSGYARDTALLQYGRVMDLLISLPMVPSLSSIDVSKRQQNLTDSNTPTDSITLTDSNTPTDSISQTDPDTPTILLSS